MRFRRLWVALCGLCCTVWFGASAMRATAQATPQSSVAEFSKLAFELTSARDAGGEAETAQERALAILDRTVLENLNGTSPDLDAVNRCLAAFITHQPPVGEGYRVYRLGRGEAVYALLADFGIEGPSAVRVYAGPPRRMALAGRVDRYVQKDFFDDYIELVPIPARGAVFVTVAGRTDALETGVFTAWHFEGGKVQAVWTSDILQQSSYQAGADGFHLTFCSDTDPSDPLQCRGMERDRFVWQGGTWKRVERTQLPATVSGQRN